MEVHNRILTSFYLTDLLGSEINIKCEGAQQPNHDLFRRNKMLWVCVIRIISLFSRQIKLFRSQLLHNLLC
jgi:hypothetical protein